MIRVLIADSHAIVRAGLKQIIEETADIVVAGELLHGSAVLRSLRTCQVDLLLVELLMHNVVSVDLIRRVRTHHPALPILVLTAHKNAETVSRALKAGATGYATKNCEPEVLIAAIRKLAAGGRFISPELIEPFIFGCRSEDAVPREVLSNREFQVLQMMATGMSFNAIAEALTLSAKTISTHKARVMQKLRLDNNAQLICYAVRHGLTSDGDPAPSHHAHLSTDAA